MKIIFGDWLIMKPSWLHYTWFAYQRPLTTGARHCLQWVLTSATAGAVVLITIVECSGDQPRSSDSGCRIYGGWPYYGMVTIHAYWVRMAWYGMVWHGKAWYTRLHLVASYHRFTCSQLVLRWKLQLPLMFMYPIANTINTHKVYVSVWQTF